MNMKRSILFLLILALLVACGTKENKTAATISLNSTDDQKFSYMLGAQFGRQAFRMIPRQMGYELIEDFTIQGVVDAALAYKDSTLTLQLSNDSMDAVGMRFSEIAKERANKTRPDSATMANMDRKLIRQHVDSLLSTLPIVAAKPGTGSAVKVLDTSSDIEKFSYMLGTQFGTQFGMIGTQLDVSLSVDLFKAGVIDGARVTRDSSSQFQLPEDSLRAIGRRFSEKGRALQQDAQKKAMEEQAKIKEKAAALVGDTLSDGTPAKINFTIPISALNSKIKTLESFANKPLFIFYYSTTCGHCRHAAPKVEEFAGKYKAEGLTTLAITSGGNTKKSIRQFSDDLKIKNMEIVLDEERLFGELYGDGYVPKFYLVNPDGTYKRYASFDDDINSIEADVKALLKK